MMKWLLKWMSVAGNLAVSNGMIIHDSYKFTVEVFYWLTEAHLQASIAYVCVQC